MRAAGHGNARPIRVTVEGPFLRDRLSRSLDLDPFPPPKCDPQGRDVRCSERQCGEVRTTRSICGCKLQCRCFLAPALQFSPVQFSPRIVKGSEQGAKPSYPTDRSPLSRVAW